VKLPLGNRRAPGAGRDQVRVGIDLGTTFSAVAWVDASGCPRMIPDDAGHTTMPSIVHFGSARNEVTVGAMARELGLAEPERMVMFVKREMGVAADRVRPDPDNVPRPYAFWGRQWSPPEISALILRELKQRAERHIGARIDAAVITVPAYFGDTERAATLQAAALADLEVSLLLNEPTAAGIAVGLRPDMTGRLALVFDLGGGTCDATLLRIDGGAIGVVATAGDHRLGGKDWDDALLAHVAGQRGDLVHDDPSADPIDLNDLRDRIERAKRILSTTDATEFVSLVAGRRHALTLTRKAFETITLGLVARCEALVREVTAAGGTSPDRVDAVVLAGGATRMPMIRRSLEGLWRRGAIATVVNPDECVALGAAIMAATQGLQPVATAQAGLRTQSAAPQALLNLTVRDVASHSLGFITRDGAALRVTNVIPRNTPVPCACTKTNLATTRAGQQALEVHVVEGESADPWLCSRTDSFECSGIPRHVDDPRIDVTFLYDTNGMISVQAVEAVSGKDLKVRRIPPVDLEELLRGVSVPMDVVLTLDVSGSMGDAMAELRAAATRFVEEVDLDLHRVAIVEFGHRVGDVHALSSEADSIIRAIGGMSAGGGTPMAAGIERALEHLLASDPEVMRCLVVMSDGSPNSREAALQAADEAKERGCLVVTVACGSADRAFMEALASGPEYAYDVHGHITIGETFSNLAREIASGGLQRLQGD